jgi:hypothetical protein
MKISHSSSKRTEDGMAVIAVIAILSFILIFVAGNLRTLSLLRADLKLVERQQTNRLAHIYLMTNSLTSAHPDSGTNALTPAHE